MIYLQNTTEYQKVYIPRQLLQTATTRDVEYITTGDVINIVESALTDYSNTEQVEGMISAATSGMATEEWVQEQGYITEHQSLSAYSTTEQMNEAIDAAVGAESARSESTYAKQSDIPDVSDFVTSADVKSQIDERNYVTSSQTKTQIEGYNYTTSAQVETQINDKHFVTSGYVNTEINSALAAESARTEETYLKISDIPDLDDFVTSADVKTQVEQYHYINSADAKTQIEQYGYATTGQVNDAIAAESARCESTYLKEHQSLAGLFDSVEYVSSAKTIFFYDKENTVVGTVDATEFIKDGMVDNVYISGVNLVISCNTDA